MPYAIWKTILNTVPVQEINVPERAEMLTVHEQYGELCIWYKCDPRNEMTKRRLACVGTGQDVPENSRYVGTGFFHGGRLVLHVFEVLTGSY